MRDGRRMRRLVSIFFQVDVNRILLIKRNAQVRSLMLSAVTAGAYGLVIGLGYGRIMTFAHSMLLLAAIPTVASAVVAWRGICPSFAGGVYFFV